ncbi:MAG: hypothetical protein ABI359_03825 [Ginsengibacter sp.]
MKKISLKTKVLFFLIVCFAISCSESGRKTAHPIAAMEDSVKAIAPDLKNVSINLPKGPGYHAFITNCSICHSPLYIQDQPNLSEKTWTAIVAKMQKTFGAPVSDPAAKEIVKYLVAIKGKS